jgi:ADP-L-glycero-D-manno-heptose 6-epimerase
LHFLDHREVSGLFNCGTGRARTWKDLVIAVFLALNARPEIEFIEMPEKLRGKYQYFTQAPVDKLRQAGYTLPFTSLEDAVRDYVGTYLSKGENEPTS